MKSQNGLMPFPANDYVQYLTEPTKQKRAIFRNLKEFG